MSQIGYSDLIWFMGVVEDRYDPQRLGRVRVRCFNVHPQDKNEVRTEDLPWAYLISGTFTADVKPPKLNTWVFGFFIDGRDCQHPMIIGALNGMPTQLPSIGAGGEITSHGGVQDDDDIPDIYQPDMSRLARGENIEQTSVLAKNMTAGETIPTGDGRGWNIPRSPYGAQYPHNRVYESGSGHVMEFDDTPGAERINIYHAAGTWIEIDSQGNMVIRVGGSKTEVVEKDGNVYIRGESNMTVENNSSIYVKGDCTLKVDGNMNTTTHGDYTLSVGGKYELNVAEGIKTRASNMYLESIAENIEIKSAVDIINNSASNYSIKSGLDTYINSGTNMHILSGENLYQTATATMHIKASGGDLFVESSANIQATSGTNTNLTSGSTTNVKASDINSQASGTFAVSADEVHLNTAGKGSATAADTGEDATEGLVAAATDLAAPPERKTVTPSMTVKREDYGYSGLDDISDVPSETSNSDTNTPLTSTAQNVENALVAAATGENGPLLDLIAEHESNGDYNIIFSGSRIPTPKPPVEMTIAEVLAWQDSSVARGSASSAIGRYQVIRSTLRMVIKAGVVSPGDLYNQTNQDAIANYLLEQRGLSRYKAGTLSREDFANNVAKEWASFPVVTGPNRGKSYYAGDGLNAALVSPEKVLSVLDRLA